MLEQTSYGVWESTEAYGVQVHKLQTPTLTAEVVRSADGRYSLYAILGGRGRVPVGTAANLRAGKLAAITAAGTLAQQTVGALEVAYAEAQTQEQ